MMICAACKHCGQEDCVCCEVYLEEIANQRYYEQYDDELETIQYEEDDDYDN